MPPIDREHMMRTLAPFLADEEPNANGWFYAYCPKHEDSQRSAGFNFEEDLWSCRAGCGSGSLMELVYEIDAGRISRNGSNGTGFANPDEVIDLEAQRSRRRKRVVLPAPTEEELEHWANVLQSREDKIEFFASKRGISAETLREFGVGWCSDAAGGHGAFSLPIRDADGRLLNVRLYSPSNRTKIWSWGATTFDPNVLFPEIALAQDEIILCEGEWDTVLARQEGINAITGTTGANQWQPKWNHRFKGKDVTIVYDRDKTGDVASEKVANQLSGIARSIRVAELPLPWSEKHGQDVTDFFVKHERTADDLRAVLRDARIVVVPVDGDATSVSVKESYNPELSGTTMAMTVSVVGKGLQTHLVPQRVSFTCGMNADKKCVGCPMKDHDGLMELEIGASDPLVLRMRDVNDIKRDEVLREAIGAHKCGKMDTEVREFLTTELLVVRTSIEEDEEEGDHRSRTVVNVGEYKTDANSLVRLTGTTHPSPVTQESLFMAWKLDQVESSLDTYRTTKEDLAMMERFRPGRKQTPLQRMGEIARDLSSNVTHIIGRTDLHIAMDLVWHSVLAFNFDGQPIDRGWLDLLVVGDARTGKSEVATKLAHHYRSGRVISCESASIPGLLGAVKTMPGSKAWALEWGAIPLNDRRLVALDEAGGLATEQIGQLSSVRSSGIAEIVKAEREQTRARTRLIWMANPRDNRHGMSSYMYGVLSIPPLIGNQEDVARFDFAMTVETGDVDLESINKRQHSKVEHRFDSESCHALVQWVWSRKRDQVLWRPESEDLVYEEAMRLGREYVPDPPLVQGQNVRYKIARLAAAVAARTFSTEDGETLLIEPRHVESAVTFLDYLYRKETFGYGEISERARIEEREAISAMDEVKEYLYSRPGLVRFLIATGGQFRRQQMEEQMNYAREEANLVIQRLSAMGMLRSIDSWDYRIMPHLNTVLREMSRMREK